MQMLTNDKYEISATIKKLADEFVSEQYSGKRYAFGRNEDSEALSKKIILDGFIDDFAQAGTIWNELPVIKRADVPVDAIVVNCVTSISPVVVDNLLKEQGLKFFGLYALPHLYPERFVFSSFVKETINNYNANKEKWQEISDCLEDEISKAVFNSVLQYRLTGDYNFMSDYKVRIKEQYFEDFLNLKAGEVFVDCGGFDGDTSEEFIARCPNYEKIYFFEPSETNLLEAKERLAGKNNIEFIDKGVSDKEECLSFSFNGSASEVSSDGEFTIQTTTIDKYTDKKVTFIKMDLEGWELTALKGSENHIKNDCPKLAIAVYHKPQDFYEIFEYVKSIQPKYKIYLRHYTQGWSETVMFFIPSTQEDL